MHRFTLVLVLLAAAVSPVAAQTNAIRSMALTPHGTPAIADALLDRRLRIVAPDLVVGAVRGERHAADGIGLCGHRRNRGGEQNQDKRKTMHFPTPRERERYPNGRRISRVPP